MLKRISQIALIACIIMVVYYTFKYYPYCKWPDVDEEELEAFAKDCYEVTKELNDRPKDDVLRLQTITDDLTEVISQKDMFDSDQWPPFDYRKDDKWDEHYASIVKHDEALKKITEDGFVFQKDAYDFDVEDTFESPILIPLRKLFSWQMAAIRYEMENGQKDKAIFRLEAMMTIVHGLLGTPSILPLATGNYVIRKTDKTILSIIPHLDSADLTRIEKQRESYPDPMDVFVKAIQDDVHFSATTIVRGLPNFVRNSAESDDYDKVDKLIIFLNWIRWFERQRAVYLIAKKKQINYIRTWDESGRNGDPVFLDPKTEFKYSIGPSIAWMKIDRIFNSTNLHEQRVKAMKTVLGWFASSEDFQALERREMEYDDKHLIVVENGKVWMEKKGSAADGDEQSATQGEAQP